MDATTPKPRLSLAALRRHWPKEAAFLAFGGGEGEHAIVATAFSEVPFAEVQARAFVPRPDAEIAPDNASLPFTTGIMGVLDYGLRMPRCFRVHQALVIDQRSGCFWRTGLGERPAESRGPALGVTATTLDAVLAAIDGGSLSDTEPSASLALVPATSDADYLMMVRRALQDIRDGRYYQINLLRYYELAAPPSLETLVRRFDRLSGPFAAWVDVPGLRLVSFSPEAFVRVEPGTDGGRIETRPIKGTAARAADPVIDVARAKALLASPKDLAELAMIVDLMRNDLSRVAVTGSVKVAEPLRLVSFPTVHHLEARVVGRLKSGTTLAALLQAVSPGGSITGAPKVEVMRAIAAYEGRDRGYFMGHAFYLDDRGRFDSSILIRTLVRQGDAADGNPYEFAAGSGIVMHSDPETERLEIEAKARVLTDPL